MNPQNQQASDFEGIAADVILTVRVTDRMLLLQGCMSQAVGSDEKERR